jgi:hypothetical protein
MVPALPMMNTTSVQKAEELRVLASKHEDDL